MTNLYEVKMVDGETAFINLALMTHFTKRTDDTFVIYPMDLTVDAVSFMSAMAAGEVGMFGFKQPPYTEDITEDKES